MTIAGLPFELPALTALHWLRPQWLWWLLALPLLALWWRRHRSQDAVWRSIVDAHLLPHLVDTKADAHARGRKWLALPGAALAICALAGPSWQRVAEPLWQNRAPLVIALDLSTATQATDLPPSRLLRARAKIAQLLHARAGGQVALVVFADDAYTVAPLTEDADNVAVFLDALTPDIMPVDGSRADRAIARSATLLRQAGFNSGDILLLTDHADASARTAAASAARAGDRVDVLGLGTQAGAAYRDVDGSISQARLDADSLRALAGAGNGRYAALTDGNDDLAALGVLDARQANAGATQGGTTRVWRDQGYWLLLPLMLLGLFAFRRGGALGALLLCALLPWPQARAADASWWRRPDQQAHARLLDGARAYREGDFAGAVQRWRGLSGADAAYDLGNALARQGEYDAAIAAYDRALQLRPGMGDAIANRNAVLAAKRRQQQQEEQKQQNQKQQNQKQGAKQGQGQPSQPKQQPSGQQQQPSGNASDAAKNDPSSQPPAQQRASTPQSQPSSGQQPEPAKAGDTKAQQQANAAQRQRMQQALQKTAKPGGKPAQAPVETAAQRERRLANDAWLRRVPDDPGGLLRAKFRLEYERRQQEGGP